MPHCRAPVDYTEAGAMRFDSSQYHMAAVKRLSEISAMKGHIEDLEALLREALTDTVESRDSLHESSTNAEGEYSDPEDAEIVADLDDFIHRINEALGDSATTEDGD